MDQIQNLVMLSADYADYTDYKRRGFKQRPCSFISKHTRYRWARGG